MILKEILPQIKQLFSIVKINWLMLFREMNNCVCIMQNYWMLTTVGGTCNYHFTLKGLLVFNSAIRLTTRTTVTRKNEREEFKST
jgi:hypothetical protein